MRKLLYFYSVNNVNLQKTLDFQHFKVSQIMESNEEKTENLQENNDNLQEKTPEITDEKAEEIVKELIEEDEINIEELTKNEEVKPKEKFQAVEVDSFEIDPLDLGGFSPSGSSDGVGDDFHTLDDETTSSKSGSSKPLNKTTADKSAKLAVNFVDILNSILCGYISGSDRQKFRLTKTEKKDLIEATTDYLEVMEISLNPSATFFFTMLTILSAKYVLTYDEYQKNKKKKQPAKIIKLPPQPLIKKQVVDPVKISLEEAEKEPIFIQEERQPIYEQKQPEKMQLSLSAFEKVIEDDLRLKEYPEKTNKRGKFDYYESGRFRGYYVFDSETGKRYACETAKEHLKDKNNQPSPVVRTYIERLCDYMPRAEAVKHFGKIIRRVKKEFYE